MSKLISKLEDTQEKDMQLTESKIFGQSTTLLLEAPKESLQILTETGLDYKLNIDKRVVNEQTAFTYFKKNMGNTFSGATIKKLCNLYGLKIIMARDFKGTIDYSLVGGKIKEFCDKNDIIPKYNKFYVLAPVNHFNGTTNSNVNCSLFYKEGNHDSGTVYEGDRLIEIFSWGEDLSEFRVFHTLFAEKKTSDDTPSSTVITYITILGFIMSIFAGFFNPFTGLFISVIASLFFLMNGLIDKNSFEEWNSLNEKG